MQDFRKLEIYRRSIKYCAEIYKFSQNLPKSEKYGLISQIKRAACSISLNISEGAGTNTNSEFIQFLSYAYRSCNEVLSCFELITEMNLSDDIDIIHTLENEGIELSKMIYTFINKLK